MAQKLRVLSILLFGFLPLALVAAPTAGYASTADQIQSGVDQAAGNTSVNNDPAGSLSGTVKKILNIMSAVAGVLAVIMIIYAGFRLVASAGSEESVKKAKSSLAYAVIGIVIVALAQIIVHFVITNVA